MAEYRDILVLEAICLAQKYMAEGWTVYFKFTCKSCGERCTLLEPNTLYEKGECYVCGHETRLDRVGFLLRRPVEDLMEKARTVIRKSSLKTLVERIWGSMESLLSQYSDLELEQITGVSRQTFWAWRKQSRVEVEREKNHASN